MTRFKDKYRVESARLKGYDYGSPGEYFVTICTDNWTCVLGDVVRGEARLSPIGQIVAEEWEKTPKIRQNVRLDAWIIMPNHLHGIILIEKSLVETHCDASLRGQNTFGPQRNNLGSIIRGFKSAATKRIHAAGFMEFGWQSRFYEHVIRDGNDLDRVRGYISNNPANWADDENFPGNVRMRPIHGGVENASALE
jgi:REP element-mobilizing transposase RayT